MREKFFACNSQAKIDISFSCNFCKIFPAWGGENFLILNAHIRKNAGIFFTLAW